MTEVYTSVKKLKFYEQIKKTRKVFHYCRKTSKKTKKKQAKRMPDTTVETETTEVLLESDIILSVEKYSVSGTFSH